VKRPGYRERPQPCPNCRSLVFGDMLRVCEACSKRRGCEACFPHDVCAPCVRRSFTVVEGGGQPDPGTLFLVTPEGLLPFTMGRQPEESIWGGHVVFERASR
jgi:hypothetical protein